MIGFLMNLLKLHHPKRLNMHFAKSDAENAIKSYKYLMGCSDKEAEHAIFHRSEDDPNLTGYKQVPLWSRDTEYFDGLDLFGHCFVTADE